MASYNYNVAKPKILEVDKESSNLTELHTYHGQNYVTISSSEGRKLMQRIPKLQSATIERVFAKGHRDEARHHSPGNQKDDAKKDDQDADADDDDEHPDLILLESKEYAKEHRHHHQHLSDTSSYSSSGTKGGSYFADLAETSKLQIKSLAFYQALLAEFIGVFMLTFIVCGLGINLDPDKKTPSINGALGGGLALATMIWCTNAISGGNLNPAMLGAIAGAATLSLLVPAAVRSQLSVTVVNKDVTLFKAFTVETIITFLLVITVFSCVDKKRKDLGGSYPLTIGLTVVVGALFGGPYTGGSMNPARSFGPAVIKNYWENHWIYWAGPGFGAFLAFFVYKIILNTKRTSSSSPKKSRRHDYK